MIDINELKQARKFDEQKLLEYGFIKKEYGYLYLAELDNNSDIFLLVTVSPSLDAITDQVIDNTIGEEYELVNNLSAQGDFVNQIRKLRDEALLSIYTQCVETDYQQRPNNLDPIYLIPEQVEDLKSALAQKQEELRKIEEMHKKIVASRSIKKCYGKEGGASVIDNSCVYQINEIQEEIDQILMKLKDYVMPKPVGEQIQIGSFVTYRDVCDGRSQGLTRTVLIVQGDVSRDLRRAMRDEDIFLATAMSDLGKALIGHVSGDVDSFVVKDCRGNQAIKHMIFIEEVDNDRIYERYELNNPLEKENVKVKQSV